MVILLAEVRTAQKGAAVGFLYLQLCFPKSKNADGTLPQRESNLQSHDYATFHTRDNKVLLTVSSLNCKASNT